MCLIVLCESYSYILSQNCTLTKNQIYAYFEQEAKSIVIKAEGDARSAALIGEAIKENPGFVQLRRIDTAQEIAQSVARSQNRIYLNADALLINLLAVSDAPSAGAPSAGAAVPAAKKK